MAHIQHGCCSNHPGMDTFIQIQDEDVQNGKFAKYVTIRSSSQNESFHLHSEAIFRYKTNLSLDMYVLISSSFTQRWNIKQGIKVGKLFILIQVNTRITILSIGSFFSKYEIYTWRITEVLSLRYYQIFLFLLRWTRVNK